MAISASLESLRDKIPSCSPSGDVACGSILAFHPSFKIYSGDSLLVRRRVSTALCAAVPERSECLKKLAYDQKTPEICEEIWPASWRITASADNVVPQANYNECLEHFDIVPNEPRYSIEETKRKLGQDIARQAAGDPKFCFTNITSDEQLARTTCLETVFRDRAPQLLNALYECLGKLNSCAQKPLTAHLEQVGCQDVVPPGRCFDRFAIQTRRPEISSNPALASREIADETGDPEWCQLSYPPPSNFQIRSNQKTCILSHFSWFGIFNYLLPHTLLFITSVLLIPYMLLKVPDKRSLIAGALCGIALFAIHILGVAGSYLVHGVNVPFLVLLVAPLALTLPSVFLGVREILLIGRPPFATTLILLFPMVPYVSMVFWLFRHDNLRVRHFAYVILGLATLISILIGIGFIALQLSSFN